MSARAAAVCETGNPPHATTYVDTVGTCWSRYGFPNATSTVRGMTLREIAHELRDRLGSVRDSTTFVPVDRYEPTMATSTESAIASSRAKFGAGSSGLINSVRSAGIAAAQLGVECRAGGKIGARGDRDRQHARSGRALLRERHEVERILGERDRALRGRRRNGEVGRVADERSHAVETRRGDADPDRTAA